MYPVAPQESQEGDLSQEVLSVTETRQLCSMGARPIEHWVLTGRQCGLWKNQVHHTITCVPNNTMHAVLTPSSW